MLHYPATKTELCQDERFCSSYIELHSCLLAPDSAKRATNGAPARPGCLKCASIGWALDRRPSPIKGLLGQMSVKKRVRNSLKTSHFVLEGKSLEGKSMELPPHFRRRPEGTRRNHSICCRVWRAWASSSSESFSFRANSSCDFALRLSPPASSTMPRWK
jgi:hypothetical protein